MVLETEETRKTQCVGFKFKVYNVQRKKIRPLLDEEQSNSVTVRKLLQVDWN